MKKLKKEDVIVYLTILLISIILCFNFIKFHTVPDTYIMLVEQGYNCLRYFNEGRIVTALVLYFGYLLNIPLKILTVFLSISSIFCLSTSAYIIYKVFAKKEDKVFNKCIKLVGSYLIVFNPLSIEHLAYVESGIICLGTLLCVLSAKILIVDNKKVLPIIMVSLAGLCYQGIINVFITISTLFIVFNDKTVKEKIKQFAWIFLDCLIAVVVTVTTIKIANYKMEVKTDRDIGIWFSQSLPLITWRILSRNWNLYPKYFIITVIAVSIFVLLINKNFKYTLKYIFVVLVAILSCSIPATFIKEMTLGLAARTTTAVGSIIGISIIALVGAKNLGNKTVIALISGAIFVINSYVYVNNGVMINISNKMEKEDLQKIVTDIKKYENDSGIKIEKIRIYYDQKQQLTFNNFPNNSFTIKTLHTVYAKYHIIDYYLGYNLKIAEENSEYEKYFKTKNWDEYSSEQLIFDGNTLHLCAY